MPRNYIHSSVWHPITTGLFQICSHSQYLHQLIGLNNVKKTKQKKVRKEVTSLEEKKLDLTQPTFVWVSEYQKAFDAL